MYMESNEKSKKHKAGGKRVPSNMMIHCRLCGQGAYVGKSYEMVLEMDMFGHGIESGVGPCARLGLVRTPHGMCLLTTLWVVKHSSGWDAFLHLVSSSGIMHDGLMRGRAFTTQAGTW
eukprot:scaffold25325_cov21-Tisochrysis_lutea.AAC.5